MNVNLKFQLELQQCTDYPLQKLLIHNNGDTLQNATLRICSNSGALIPFEAPLPVLAADTVTEIPQAQQLQLDPAYLAGLCHPLTTEMVISVWLDTQNLCSTVVQFSADPIRVLSEEAPAGDDG